MDLRMERRCGAGSGVAQRGFRMIPTRFVAGLSAALFLAGMAPATARSLDVVASFSVLADVVSNVGGEHVRVTSLIPAGGDPHEFEPSPADAKALKAADVVFLSGLGLEGWMTRLASASGYEGKPVIVSEGISTREMDEDGERITDPHVWNAADNVLVWIENIEKALVAADPEDAAAINANAQAYAAKVRELDAYARTELGKLPREDRKILTSHDAFGYFGRAYGLELLAPLGLSTDAEASAKTIAALIRQIRKEKVKAYFFENSNDPRLVKQIGEATGAQPGGELYVESLSPKDGPAATYLAMFRFNTDQILTALRK
jgi:zinc/manganese transport system substrate-binding protein